MQKTAQLRVTDASGVQKTIPLRKPVFTIGRRPENDLQVTSRKASRQHGSIVCENGVYYVVDSGSKGGIFVNSKRVERTALRHLDRISLGGVDDFCIQFLAADGLAEQPSLGSEQSPLLSGERRFAATAKEELKNLARYLKVNQAFKFSLTPDNVLRLIVDAAVEMAAAERGLIMLRSAGGMLEFKVARDSNRNDVSRNDFPLSTSVVRQVFLENRTVVLDSENERPNFGAGPSVTHLNLASVIGVPLHRFHMQSHTDASTSTEQELIGVLYLDSRNITKTLSRTSLKLLESLAFEASKSFENVRLLHEEQEKQELEREFHMAREVQVALMPASSVESDQFELAAHSIACRYVGGDFYDLLTLQDGSVVLTLADVSGKGVSAALLASLAQGVIEAEFYGGHSPAEVVGTLNRLIVNRSGANRFITMFCAVLDGQGNFTWVNAGHNPPILARHGGKTETLSTRSLVVGAFDFAEYRVTSTQLDAGDVVFSFSDGVTEAVNSSGEMFGEERLENLVRTSVNLDAEQIKDRVLEEVLDFTRGLPQSDDITMIVLKMRSTP